MPKSTFAPHGAGEGFVSALRPERHSTFRVVRRVVERERLAVVAKAVRNRLPFHAIDRDVRRVDPRAAVALHARHRRALRVARAVLDLESVPAHRVLRVLHALAHDREAVRIDVLLPRPRDQHVARRDGHAHDLERSRERDPRALNAVLRNRLHARRHRPDLVVLVRERHGRTRRHKLRRTLPSAVAEVDCEGDVLAVWMRR